jgi:hypothetical protein
MRLSRFATLWNVEGEVEQVPNASPLMRYIYEPLKTHAPPPDEAEPYCCYRNTVIFYEARREGSAIKEMTRCEHYNLAAAPAEHLVYHDGKWWEVQPDCVLWRNDQWQFRYRLDARGRIAHLLNLGHEAVRAEFAR